MKKKLRKKVTKPKYHAQKILVKGETRTHVLLLGRPQIIPINLYAKCQKLRQVLEVGQLPEVATATNSDYATCGLKRESCRAEKKASALSHNTCLSQV